jgi:hypothetical protein
MTGDSNRGDAAADKWRERFEKAQRETDNALTRLDVRADMKSMGEDEISEVIDQRTLEARKKSDPPGGVVKHAFSLARSMKSDWAKVALIVSLAAIGAIVYVMTRP